MISFTPPSSRTGTIAKKLLEPTEHLCISPCTYARCINQGVQAVIPSGARNLYSSNALPSWNDAPSVFEVTGTSLSAIPRSDRFVRSGPLRVGEAGRDSSLRSE